LKQFILLKGPIIWDRKSIFILSLAVRLTWSQSQMKKCLGTLIETISRNGQYYVPYKLSHKKIVEVTLIWSQSLQVIFKLVFNSIEILK